MLGELTDRLQRISGGSSDTELNELIVSPIGSPLAVCAVITVMPVAKLPSVLRRSRQFLAAGVSGRFSTGVATVIGKPGSNEVAC